LDIKRIKIEEKGGSCTVRRFIICTHPKISLGRSIEEKEVGGACYMHGVEKKSVQGFGGKARRKETTLKSKA
jgi:hypothetical protein